MSKVRGRPRASGDSKSRQETEAEILRAAAKLFGTVGYSATSTRLIADTAGLRQASIYHYFKAKQDMLLALLLQTVTPSLDAATKLMAASHSPASRLWSLCEFDSNLLASDPDNLGALYLLPESNDVGLDEFRLMRKDLQAVYLTLVAKVMNVTEKASAAQAVMVMALVESVILSRRDQQVIPVSNLPAAIADSALRMLGMNDAAITEARAEAATF
jgi:AcrR family transcriptional regulator